MKTLVQQKLEKFSKKFFNEAGEEVPASAWETGHVEFFEAGNPVAVGIIEKDADGWVGALGPWWPFGSAHEKILAGEFPGL